jgi:acyl dehydratase
LESFRRFAELTGDAHPLHYDEAYAANTRFGKCVAHGLYLMALTALGATEMSPRLENAMIAMVDQSCRLVRPAFPGDSVTCEYEVSAVESKPESASALVRFTVRLLNQSGEMLLEGHQSYLLRRRPDGSKGG